MIATISIILLIICLIIIAMIIIKKFPALAILDVENIPGKKEARFKEEIIKKRLERDLAKWGIIFVNIWNFFNRVISGTLHRSLEKLANLQESYRKSKKISLSQRRERIRELFRLSQENVKNGELEKAEDNLIEIISLDQKKLPAFISLAEVYAKGKKWPEARQTLGHALKLIKANSRDEFFMSEANVPEIYFSLSWVCENLGDKAAALDNIQEALEFESNNPRYLDYAIELAIDNNKKDFASLLLERLREVNPENAKLIEWEEKIQSLPDENEPSEPAIE